MDGPEVADDSKETDATVLNSVHMNSDCDNMDKTSISKAEKKYHHGEREMGTKSYPKPRSSFQLIPPGRVFLSGVALGTSMILQSRSHAWVQLVHKK